MILDAFKAKEQRDRERFEAFERLQEQKHHALERELTIRLDVQKDAIKAVLEKIGPMERKLSELSQHVGFIRFLCDVAKWFKPRPGP